MKSLFPPKDKISAYILGLYASDGHLRNKTKWSIYQSDEPFLQVISDELTKRSIPNCIVKKRGGCHELVITSDKDAAFLKSIGLGKNKTYFAGSIPLDRDHAKHAHLYLT